jgi:quercetin dioxygenase-like cupin family protein
MTTTRTTRRRISTSAAVALAAALSVTGLLGVTSVGSAQAEPSPIAVTGLTGRAAFTDDVAVQIRNRFSDRGTDVINMRDASNVFVAEVVIQPGATFPWHTHPGPVVLNIAEGEFTYVLGEDCVERNYVAGEALIDAGGDNVHMAFNPGDTETVVIATFFNVPDEGALTIPIAGEQMDTLDATCSLTTPRPS